MYMANHISTWFQNQNNIVLVCFMNICNYHDNRCIIVMGEFPLSHSPNGKSCIIHIEIIIEYMIQTGDKFNITRM